MSGVALEDPAALHDPQGSRRGTLHKANTRLGRLVLIVVALAPLPLGSARPLAWAVNAAAIALIGLVYWLSIRRISITLRFPPMAGLTVPLFLVVLVYLSIQMLDMPWLAAHVPILLGDGTPLGNTTLSIAQGPTWLMLLRFSSYGLLALLVAQFAANHVRSEGLLRALFAAVCAYAVFGLFALTQLGDPVLFFEKWSYQGSATGPFVNRNSYATFLAFGLVVGTGLLLVDLARLRAEPGLGGRRRALRLPPGMLLCAVGLIVILAALIASRSRMGLAAGLIGMAATAALGAGRAGFGRAAVGLTLGTVVGALAALFLLYGAGVTERLGSVERDTDVRWALYTQIWDMILTRPWLGFGGGTFELAYPLYHALPVSPDAVWDKAHNTYLALWAELGLVFGSLPIAIVALYAVSAWRRRADPDDWGLPTIALGAIVVAAIHSLVDFSLEIQANALIFILILGLGAARPRRTR